MRDDNVTYDEREGKYVRPVFDMYKYYHGEEPDFDALLDAMSVGMMTRKRFERQDGTMDIAAAISCGRDLMMLWKTDVSPKAFMNKEKGFSESMREYADATGVESAIDAYASGVPIDDLLA